MMDLLFDIAKLSPVIALLIVCVIYLYRMNKSLKVELKEERENCQQELAELNQKMRDSEVDNLQMINKLSNALEKLNYNNKSGNSTIHNEIRNLKDFINIKLDSLRNG